MSAEAYAHYVLWYLLLSEENKTWEQRIGCWVAACRWCQREAWQLTFRMWRTNGNGFSPATPYGAGFAEVYQVRCAGCGAATSVAHPSQWVGAIGAAFTYENLPPMQAQPAYVRMAYPYGR